MLTKSLLSTKDDIGTVYLSDNLVLRGIKHQKETEVLALLNCGLIDRLVEEGFFPRTSISRQQLRGYSLVLEHEKIDPVVYPYEWSPEMLRRAGLVLLEINNIANEFGYELKDSHVYNMVYRYCQPVYVDFGSLVKRNTNYKWVAYERFLSAYICPLKIYKIGGTGVFKNFFLVSGQGILLSEYWLLKNSFLRILGRSIIDKISRYICLYKNINNIPSNIVEKKFKYKILGKIISKLMSSRYLDFTKFNPHRLSEELKGIQWSHTTTWGTYHQRVGLYLENGEANLSNRMKTVLELVESLGIQSVTELAGNQGVLARQIAKLPTVKRVNCTDYDENAIDRLFLNLSTHEKVTPIVLDFMRTPIGGRGFTASSRMKSDLVISLAVTHHLILGQNYSLDAIFTNIFSFTTQYAIIEFMPLGLYSKRLHSGPPVPEWYCEDWFVTTLIDYGDIKKRVELEKNRILYLIETTPKISSQ